MDAAIWQTWVATMVDAMQYPGFQEVWSRRRHHFTKGFQDFMDNLIAEPKNQMQLYDPPSD